MLLLNQTNKLTFAMTVMGTAATPTARVLIGESPTWSYPAYKAGTDWESTIELPPEAGVGPKTFKVEVLINGRLFVPINTMIDVGGVKPAEEPHPEQVPPKPAEEFTIIKPMHEPAVAEEQKPAVPAEPKPVAPKKDKPKSLLGALEETAKKKPVPLPKRKGGPVEVSAKPLGFSIKDIANEHPVGVMEAAKPVPRVARQSEVPIKVTKGSIIYK